MKNKLPVYLENLDLPIDPYKKDENKDSYGYVSIMYIIALIITLGSVLTVIIFGSRWYEWVF